MTRRHLARLVYDKLEHDPHKDAWEFVWCDCFEALDALGYCIMPKEADNRICEAMLDGLGSSILHGSDAGDHPRPQSMYRAAVATGSIKLEKAG